MPRTFLVQPERTVTLPQGLSAGPGATNMRLDPGAVVTLDDDKCVEFSRFINGRKRSEDWHEIDSKDAPKNPTEHRYVNDPHSPGSGQVRVETGAPSSVGKKG